MCSKSNLLSAILTNNSFSFSYLCQHRVMSLHIPITLQLGARHLQVTLRQWPRNIKITGPLASVLIILLKIWSKLFDKESLTTKSCIFTSIQSKCRKSVTLTVRDQTVLFLDASDFFKLMIQTNYYLHTCSESVHDILSGQTSVKCNM